MSDRGMSDRADMPGGASAVASTSRRRLLLGGAALAASAVVPSLVPAVARADTALPILAGEARLRLPGCTADSPLWGYGEQWPPVVRVRRGAPFAARLTNALPVQTTIHWHGVRVPYDQDGVPYFTQPPVEPGQEFTYRFAPPDPGTFFFHPHCDTLTALSRGLAGVLIVEDERDAGRFDVEHVLALKDWRVLPDGNFDDLTTDEGAAKSGTYGGLRTVNGGAAPTIVVPPSARVRLRLVNLDVTRIAMLGVTGAEARIIATDGNACPPLPVGRWRLGPAMRADLALVAPAGDGAVVAVDDVRGTTPTRLATLVARGRPAGPSVPVSALALPPAELPEPDLAGAEPLSFHLLAGQMDAELAAWAESVGVSPEALCVSRRIFWTINRRAWPGLSNTPKPAPLAELRSGRSYVAEIFNGTPHQHPMHLHGHTFKVIASSRRDVPPHWSDTVLVAPKERVRIAFVAGEPGDWMFHCHIIEHQETGMMGYLRVT